MNLFFAPENLPFAVAIAVMLALTAIEGVAVLMGGSLSHWADGLLHHGDGVHGDLAGGFGGGVLGWLHFGKVPLLILLIVFLTAFGLGGFAVQLFARGLLGAYLPALLAVIPAFFVAVPVVRVGGAVIAKIMPKDETSAVSEDSLVGRAGVVIVGTARLGEPAQVRLRDAHGQTHYVMAEPDAAGESFPSGTEVLLVSRISARYRAIRNPHPELLHS